MSSVPQGAYAAHKVHYNMNKNLQCEDTFIALKKRGAEKTPPQYHYPEINKKYLEHPPAKYNSKLMNSIWGLYNRYSVHNLKKITDGKEAQGMGAQQLSAAVAPFTPTSRGDLLAWEAMWAGNTY